MMLPDFSNMDLTAAMAPKFLYIRYDVSGSVNRETERNDQANLLELSQAMAETIFTEGAQTLLMYKRNEDGSDWDLLGVLDNFGPDGGEMQNASD